MPIFAICLTSCGENKVVSNYIIEHGVPDEKDGYVLQQKYLTPDYTSVSADYYYYPDTNLYYLNTKYQVSNGQLTMTLDGTVCFKWGNFKNGTFYSKLTLKHYQTETYRFDYKVNKLHKCPEVDFASTSLMFGVTQFEGKIIDGSMLLAAGVEPLEVAIRLFQETIAINIDSSIRIW